MFEKSLQDLVKGIRGIKGDTGPFIAKSILEIRAELKDRDVLVKAQALQKLCYVSMVVLYIQRMSMLLHIHRCTMIARGDVLCVCVGGYVCENATAASCVAAAHLSLSLVIE